MLPPPNVVVVARRAPIRRLIELNLRLEGFHVQALSDGQEALEHLLTTAFDVALLDAYLPRVDGFALCRAVRAAKPTPIIMLLMRGDDESASRSEQAGATAHLLLPFGVEDLLACIKAVLASN